MRTPTSLERTVWASSKSLAHYGVITLDDDDDNGRIVGGGALLIEYKTLRGPFKMKKKKNRVSPVQGSM